MLSTVALIAALATLPLASSGASPISALRWDATGHQVIAAIAYERLRPATRARVNALLRRHPDLDSLARGLDLGTDGGARELFMRASVWPDQIRRDPRFYNETDPSSRATPFLPGFPDMKRRAGWHYVNRSFATDGTATILPGTRNTVTEMGALARALGDSGVSAPVRAYGLSWLIHVVGDLHQPLHGISRSSRRHPLGDSGGNAERVRHGPLPADTLNLHAYWDGLPGRAARGAAVAEVARHLTGALPSSSGDPETRVDPAALETTIARWADESATLARYVVYDLDERQEGDAPIRISFDYDRRAGEIARHRMTLAGYRLAALLESTLG